MPFIEVNLSQELTVEQETALKTGFGALVSLIPGKSEDTLMLNFKAQSKMWFRGKNDRPTAFVHVILYGRDDQQSYQNFSDKAMELLERVAGVDPSNIYVKFEETQNFFWA